jgi:hypothetical protein
MSACDDVTKMMDFLSWKAYFTTGKSTVLMLSKLVDTDQRLRHSSSS